MDLKSILAQWMRNVKTICAGKPANTLNVKVSPERRAGLEEVGRNETSDPGLTVIAYRAEGLGLMKMPALLFMAQASSEKIMARLLTSSPGLREHTFLSTTEVFLDSTTISPEFMGYQQRAAIRQNIEQDLCARVLNFENLWHQASHPGVQSTAAKLALATASTPGPV